MEIMQTATYGNPLFAVTIETSVPTERLFVNQETVMTTVITTHTGKPVVQNPVVEVPQHHLPDIGTIKSVFALESVFIDLLECFKMILHGLGNYYYYWKRSSRTVVAIPS